MRRRAIRTAGRLVLLLLMLVVGASTASQRFEARGSVELAFSPWDSPESVLLALIDGAREEVLVQAYAFTSRRIARALVSAAGRGVQVSVLVDHELNRRGNPALSLLLDSPVELAWDSAYRAAHNKVMVVDAGGRDCAVATGSYNFTWSAENRNAENLLVLRGQCALAAAFRDNWLRHRQDAERIKHLR